MNGIKIPKRFSPDNYYLTSEFRQIDSLKFDEIIENMFKQVSIASKDFKCETDKKFISTYAGIKENIMTQYHFNMVYEGDVTKTKVKYPTLVNGNFFKLNGSLYTPLLFLEKNPIDKIGKHSKKGKVFLTLMPHIHLTFDFNNMKMVINKRSIPLQIVFESIFKDDTKYLDSLVVSGILPDRLSEDEIINVDVNAMKSLFKALNIYAVDGYIDAEGEIHTLRSFIDKFLVLDMFKEMFDEIYNIHLFSDLVKYVINVYINNDDIEIPDLKNRRVVLFEYLATPIFDYYIRLLSAVIDTPTYNKNMVKKLPTLNNDVIMSTGFRKFMHNGQYYDISLPYPNPLINKLSQDIHVVNNKIPKSWSTNHPSGFGILCPISVSAMNMGTNIVMSNSTLLSRHGVLSKIKTNIN